MPNISLPIGDGVRAILVWLGALLVMTGGALPAGAASDAECQQYADSAVKDFNTAINPANAANCHVPMGPRWQPSWQNHYNWCLTVSTAAYQGERNAREAILRGCGARIPIEGQQ